MKPRHAYDFSLCFAPELLMSFLSSVKHGLNVLSIIVLFVSLNMV